MLLHKISVITWSCTSRPCSHIDHWARSIIRLARCDPFSKRISGLLEDHIVYGSWEAFTTSKRSRVVTTVMDPETGYSWAECQNHLRNVSQGEWGLEKAGWYQNGPIPSPAQLVAGALSGLLALQ